MLCYPVHETYQANMRLIGVTQLDINAFEFFPTRVILHLLIQKICYPVQYKHTFKHAHDKRAA